MFLRRLKRTRLQHLKESLWPKMGFYRLFVYYQHLVGRLKATPYAIAAGFASVIAIAFTPFLGFHLILAGALTWILGGSLIATVLGSVIAGNFWTYPLIFVGTYKLGKFMMGEMPPDQVKVYFTWQFLLSKPMEYLVPMLLGSLPLCILSWAVTFYIVRRVVKGYKDARHLLIHRPNIKEN